MTRIIDTQKARRKTPVSISNKNTQTETSENRTTVDEAIDWLSTLPLACKDGAKAKLITDMAIEALKDRPQGEWVDNGIEDSILSKCTVCGFDVGAFTFNYCPNCGADMRGEEE